MKSTVLRCAEMCRDGYGGEPKDNHFNVGDLRFAYEDGILMLRGTANLKNVKRDLSIFPTYANSGYLAHRGFVEAYYDLMNDVCNVIPFEKRRSVIVTGHSLGGAIALLFADYFKAKVITFGCPRLYFRFSKAPDLDHLRVICDDDPVPMVPRLLYKHATPAKVLTDNDRGIDVKDHGIHVYIDRIKKQM